MKETPEIALKTSFERRPELMKASQGPETSCLLPAWDDEYQVPRRKSEKRSKETQDAKVTYAWIAMMICERREWKTVLIVYSPFQAVVWYVGCLGSIVGRTRWHDQH